MHKDELLQLHSLLCQVKRCFEDAGLPIDGTFDEYDDLQVSPQHIHKSKTDHKRAVFMLGKGLADLALADDEEHRDRLRERFDRMAEGKKAHAPPRNDDADRPLPPMEEDHLPSFAVRALSG